MSAYIRPKVTGACVFFTVALARRDSSLLVRDVALLRTAVRQTRAERPFGIDAFVVLPDHIHAIWTLPAGDRDYGVRWGAIKARFTRALREEPSNNGRPGLSPAYDHSDPGELPMVTSGRYAGQRPSLRLDKRERGVWQRRFWEHHIRDEGDYRAHLRYCWLNPVKHGLVERPEDWPYSSVHRDAGLLNRINFEL
jgi:putative transposase